MPTPPIKISLLQACSIISESLGPADEFPLLTQFMNDAPTFKKEDSQPMFIVKYENEATFDEDKATMRYIIRVWYESLQTKYLYTYIRDIDYNQEKENDEEY
jgi:hypothetical protein